MSYTYEGTIEIPLEEFWKFVMNYVPTKTDEIRFGVPSVNVECDVIEVDFASSSDISPETWAEKPKVVLQWEELRKGAKVSS